MVQTTGNRKPDVAKTMNCRKKRGKMHKKMHIEGTTSAAHLSVRWNKML